MSKVKYIAVVLLTVLLGGLIGFSASAETNETEVEVQFTFEPSLTVSLSGGDLIINDLAPGTAKNSNEIGITVRTNNIAGYSLSATVGNDLMNSQSLLRDGGGEFSSVDTGANLTALVDDNTWGYSINSGTNYSGLPLFDAESGVELNSSDSAANETTMFLIGARASSDQQSGDYSNVINFAVVAKVMKQGIESIDNMQQMTAEVCTMSNEGDTKQLIDTRDGKKYWVAKMKDGNCWMTQNLDLDIPAEGLLAADTDIETDWTPETAATTGRTAPTATATGNAPVSGGTATGTLSWDAGNYVLSTPGNWDYCTTNANTVGGTAACATAGWTDVTGYTDDFDSTIGGSVSGASINAVDTANSSYDAHYHIGNYYEFNTATAGLGATVTSSQGEVANSSICPRGWKLPLSGSNFNNSEGSFYNLLNAYGVASSSSANSLKYVSAPLYLVPGGMLYYDRDGLYRAGNYGYYWSRVSYVSDRAYALGFNGSYVDPSDNDYRKSSMSVRCVAPGA